MEKEKCLLPSGLLSTLNESDLDPVIAANLSGSFQNASQITGTDVEGDMHNISSLSQKSCGSLSFDVRKFSTRLSSHMSTFSDTLFSDIEDIEDITEPQVTHQETQVENPPVLQTCTLKDVLMQHANLNKGAVYLPSTSLPRTQTPQPAGVTALHGIPEEVTPTKSVQPEIDPLTPTANLKVLISAASPEIRNRERQKLNDTGEFDMINTSFINSCENTSDIIVDDVDYLSTVDTSEGLFMSSKQNFTKEGKNSREKFRKNVNSVDWEDGHIEPLVSVSRKDKSLGLLCQRFVALYPDNPAPTERPEICLDGIAIKLGVERRRIYDIINVLESVDIVSRVGKNKYAWHGKTALYALLANLRVKAEHEGYRERLLEMRDCEYSEMTKSSKTKTKPIQKQELHRKDKSLGLLCQKFLMLFLVSEEPRVINLDLSAKILIGDPDVDKTETGKYKTKIRRLYDIANILTSLDLICKIHVTEARGRKPAFQYTGPDPETLDQIPVGDALKHRNENKELKKKFITVQPSSLPPRTVVLQPPTKQAVQAPTKQAVQTAPGAGRQKERTASARKSLTRHASFEQICQVAEQELEREWCQTNNPLTPPAGNCGSTRKNSNKMNSPFPLTSSQIDSPDAAVKQEPPKTTVLNLTEDQLQDMIKMLSEQPENTQVCLKTDSMDKSPTLLSKELLCALKKASNKQAKSVIPGELDVPLVLKSECNSPAVVPSSDSGYFSFTAGDSSSVRSTLDTPSRVFLKRDTESGYSPSHLEAKKPRMMAGKQEFSSEGEEVENEEPLDLSRYNLLNEPSLAQGPDLEVASIIKDSQMPNKMTNKLSPLKSLNIGDSFSSNVPLLKTPSFGLPKIPSMECGLSSPYLSDKTNRPNSQLNTPTFPMTSCSGGQEGSSVFQFPTPGRSRGGEALIRSQPTTPTYRLACTNSPVMLLPSRPASFGGVACPSEGTNEKQPVTPAVALLRGTHPVSVQRFSNILMTPTSDHITAYKISPFTSTPTTPFLLPGSANKVLNHITPVHLRPGSGIRPSMNKMVNLGSVFAPHSDTVEQISVSALGNNSMVSSSSNVTGSEMTSMSLDENCTTPVGPHLNQLCGVVTPGTFFSHTPGSELFSPLNIHDAVEFSGTSSAFQSLKTTGKAHGTFVPPRKLSLPDGN